MQYRQIAEGPAAGRYEWLCPVCNVWRGTAANRQQVSRQYNREQEGHADGWVALDAQPGIQPPEPEPAGNPVQQTTTDTKENAMLTPEIIRAARQWGEAQGFRGTGPGGRTIVDAAGNGVALGWRTFAMLHQAEAQDWIASRPARSAAGGARGERAPGKTRQRTPEEMGIGIGSVLRHKVQGTEYLCRIEAGPDGSWEFVIDGVGRFNHQDKAAQAIAGPGRGSWAFWLGRSPAAAPAPVQDSPAPAPAPEPIRGRRYHCEQDGLFQVMPGQPVRCPVCDERPTKRPTRKAQDQQAA